MTNDNTPKLRLVEDTKDENKRIIIGFLRTAIEAVEQEDCIGVMISLVKADASIMNICSDTNQRHLMVAAAVYQLLDITGTSVGEEAK